MHAGVDRTTVSYGELWCRRALHQKPTTVPSYPASVHTHPTHPLLALQATRRIICGNLLRNCPRAGTSTTCGIMTKTTITVSAGWYKWHCPLRPRGVRMVLAADWEAGLPGGKGTGEGNWTAAKKKKYCYHDPG